MTQPETRSQRSALSRREVREVVAPLGAGRAAQLSPAWKIAIVDDGRGVAEALTAAFSASGYKVVAPDHANALIFLGGLRSPDTIDSAIVINREAFQYAHLHAATLSERGGAFITVQNTGGDFGVSGRAGLHAWGAGLSGLVKTAAQEWPNAIVKAIDLECGEQSPAELAQRLVAEILCGGPELEVGLRADGRRTTLVMESASLDAPISAQPPLDASSVIIASGGGRGVTAAALIAVARDSGARIALLGRTPLEGEQSSISEQRTEEALKRVILADAKAAGATLSPRELHQRASAVIHAREVRATLEAIRAVGSEADYYAVDIQDGPSLRSALTAIRKRWGRIDALVHGAGVLADKPIARKSMEEFDRVLSVKVGGLRNLLAATEEDQLRVICLFSSIVARTGNAGQADYAMANTVLDVVAAAEARRRGAATVVKSINWGPWDGGMVTPALAEHFRKRGMAPIPIEAGANAFVTEVQRAPSAAVSVVVL